VSTAVLLSGLGTLRSDNVASLWTLRFDNVASLWTLRSDNVASLCLSFHTADLYINCYRLASMPLHLYQLQGMKVTNSTHPADHGYGQN